MPDPPGPCVHPDVGAYALGLLDAEELSAYERHLSGCVQCARTLEGLAPLVELLGQVDAASLLAGPDRRRVHRFAAHPPGAVGALFPRQREPSHDRVRRPHLRAWDELDDRFRGPDRAAPAGVASREAEQGPAGVAPREAEQASVAPREAEQGSVAPREAEQRRPAQPPNAAADPPTAPWPPEAPAKPPNAAVDPADPPQGHPRRPA
jgi:hypothetical protein